MLFDECLEEAEFRAQAETVLPPRACPLLAD